MPLYEYQCDKCAHRFEVIQKFSDAPIEVCPKCGGAGEEAAVVAGDSVQGQRLLHQRLRAARATAPPRRRPRIRQGDLRQQVGIEDRVEIRFEVGIEERIESLLQTLKVFPERPGNLGRFNAK
jgi:putative FmdB family regulatory protein